MELAILIVSSLSLVAFIVLIIILSVKKDKKENNEMSIENLKQLAVLETKLSQINDSVKNDIEMSMGKQMKELLAENNKNSEANNAKLERFQNNIQESLNKRFDALNLQMDNKLKDINKKVDERLEQGFKNTTETMAQVRERLQAIDDAQKNIENLSKDVVSLKNVLEGNQTRGQYGEFQLGMILNSVFNGATHCYEEQYTLKKGRDGNDVRADAVVFMPEPNKMICIDSKFPFQDYSKIFESDKDEEKNQYRKAFKEDVKKHIRDISDKYIIDGMTAPEAIMFVPNDGVFAYIHQEFEDIIELAQQKRVILTSPSTLRPILVTINMVRIEVQRNKHIKEISNQLVRLGKDFRLFSEEWSKLSKSIDTIAERNNKLDKRVNRINSHFESISTADDLDAIEAKEEVEGESDGEQNE